MDKPLVVVNVNLGAEHGGRLIFKIDTSQVIKSQVLEKIKRRYTHLDDFMREIVVDEVISQVPK